jgi:hypothetical protein
MRHDRHQSAAGAGVKAQNTSEQGIRDMAENGKAWTPRRYSVAVSVAGKREDMLVDGFASGFFGIDERPNLASARSKAWAIIHLPTGYAAGFAKGPIANAKRVASALNRAANWDFDTSKVAPEVGKAARAVLDAHKSVMIDADDVGAFVYPEERLTTPAR